MIGNKDKKEITKCVLKNFLVHRMADNDFVIIDVIGTRFVITKLFLKRNSSTLFGQLIVDKSDDYDQNENNLPKGIRRINGNEFFVERSPDLVKIVIQYLITSQLHVPHWVCHEEIVEEFAFWRVQPETLCINCAGDYESLACCNVNEGHPEIFVETGNKWTSIKRKLWTFLEDPTSSVTAMVYCILYLC